MDEQGGKSENPWFTDDPIAEAPLKVIIMLSSCKNLLRPVSKLFKSHAEEGTKKITWKGPDEEEEEGEEEDQAKQFNAYHCKSSEEQRWKNQGPSLQPQEHRL